MTQLLLLALAGCNPAPIAAPDGYTLTGPDDLSFGMDAGYVSPNDNIGYLALGIFGVDDTETYGANGILVEIISGWTGAYLIPEEAITIVTSQEEACASAPSDDVCHAYFDPENGTYVEFAGDYEDIDFRPNYFSGATDHNGNLRVYVLVDSVPIDPDGNPVPVPIYAAITNETENWTLTPIGADG